MTEQKEQHHHQQEQQKVAMESPSERPSSHVRPRVRSRGKAQKTTATASPPPTPTRTAVGTKADAALAAANVKDGGSVNSTNSRMKAWMGVGGGGTAAPAATGTAAQSVVVVSSPPNIMETAKDPTTKKHEHETVVSSETPKSILKAPKYTSANKQHQLQQPVMHESSMIMQSSGSRFLPTMVSETQDLKPAPEAAARSGPVVCKKFVVERDPSVRPRRRKVSSRQKKKTGSAATSSLQASAVEGYVPQSSHIASVKFDQNVPSPANVSGGPQASSKQANAASVPPAKVGSSNTARKRTDEGEDNAEDNGEDDGDENPLILNSVEELLVAAGHEMPQNPDVITDDTQMVEANISFSCMSPAEYKDYRVEAKEEEEVARAAQYKAFKGRMDIFDDDDDDNADEDFDDADNENQNNLDKEDTPEGDDDDGDDASLMEMLESCKLSDEYYNDDDGGGDDINTMDGEGADANGSTNDPSSQRAFMKFWNVIAEWITPQAVQWLQRLVIDVTNQQKLQASAEQDGNTDGDNKAGANANSPSTTPTIAASTEWAPQVDRSDVGASRCAGLMAMIKMNLPRCLNELTSGKADDMVHVKRKAERRLADFLRVFDYSTPVAKLALAEWKAMTVILLDMVLLELRFTQELTKTPGSAQAVGLSKEEYVYLTRNAVTTLGRGTAA